MNGISTTIEEFRLKMVAKRSPFDSAWIQGYADAQYHQGKIELGNVFSVFYFSYPVCCGHYLLSSLQVEGVTYSNVVVSSYNSATLFYEYYWAPSKGLVKVVWQQLSPFKRTVHTLLRHN